MTDLEKTKKMLLHFTITCIGMTTEEKNCIGMTTEEKKQELSDIISGLMNDIESYAKIEVLNEFKNP